MELNERMELNKRLANIQQKLKAPKGQFNKFANFNYRSCEDILEAVKPLLSGLTLTISDEIVPFFTVDDSRFYVKATVTVSDGIDNMSATAFAREADTKTGMDQAQVTGAASSYARKYALNGLFAIDDTADADTKDNAKEVKYPEIKEKITVADRKMFTDENGEIARDIKGHTACVSCGKVVGVPVEEFSKKKYGKILCMLCQSKEGKDEEIQSQSQ